MVYMFFNGDAMRGGRLHDQLHGAPLLAETQSAPRYRFYSVAGKFPAMDEARDAPGRAVAGELYDVPMEVLRDSLLPSEPSELELSIIELADGTASLAVVLRPELRGSTQLTDISDIGSWRRYREMEES